MAGKVWESYIQVRESDGKVRESDILPRILRSVLTCVTEAVDTLWRMFDDEYLYPVRLRCLKLDILDMEIVK